MPLSWNQPPIRISNPLKGACLGVKWDPYLCELKPPLLDRSHLEPLRALRRLVWWDLNNAWRMTGGHVNDVDEVVGEMCICPGYFSIRYLQTKKGLRKSSIASDISIPEDALVTVVTDMTA